MKRQDQTLKFAHPPHNRFHFRVGAATGTGGFREGTWRHGDGVRAVKEGTDWISSHADAVQNGIEERLGPNHFVHV